MRRATDSTGQYQPRHRALRAVRGRRSIYHKKAIQMRHVMALLLDPKSTVNE